MARSKGLFRLLEALVDGAAATQDARRRQQGPTGPMRGRPQQRPTQQRSQPKPGCGGCNTGRRR